MITWNRYESGFIVLALLCTVLPMASCAQHQPDARHLPQDGAEPGLGDRLQRVCNSAGGRRLYGYGILLSPAAGAVLMSLSTVIVAINSRLLKIA